MLSVFSVVRSIDNRSPLPSVQAQEGSQAILARERYVALENIHRAQHRTQASRFAISDPLGPRITADNSCQPFSLKSDSDTVSCQHAAHSSRLHESPPPLRRSVALRTEFSHESFLATRPARSVTTDSKMARFDNDSPRGGDLARAGALTASAPAEQPGIRRLHEPLAAKARTGRAHARLQPRSGASARTLWSGAVAVRRLSALLRE